MPGAVAQRNNPANDPNVKPIKHRSKFKPNSSIFGTFRFSEVTPFHALSTVQDDSFNLRVASDVDTFTMKAPVMSPIRMNKTYIHAPLRAILPQNADLVITNPLTGDDVDARLVNTVTRYAGYLYDLTRNEPTSFTFGSTTANWGTLVHINYDLFAAAQSSAGDNRAVSALLALIKMTQSLNPLFSKGSLPYYLGINMTDFLKGNYKDNNTITARYTYDEIYDLVANYVNSCIDSFRVYLAKPLAPVGTRPTDTWSLSQQPDTIFVITQDRDLTEYPNAISFRNFLQMLNDGEMVQKIDSVNFNTAITIGNLENPGIAGDPLKLTKEFYNDALDMSDGLHDYVNFARCVAYQLACAQFFTDDAVDYIYSPKLWHENMTALALAASPYSDYYQLNGTRHHFDSVSGARHDVVLSEIDNGYTTQNGHVINSTATSWDYTNHLSNNVGSVCANYYFHNLYSFQRSLRYRDYFVGSRVRPLAVGSTAVTVNANQVDVVDITKSIQMQRFLNQVNRIGRTLKAYTQGIFGVTPQADPAECIFLGNTVDVIGAEETANTGSAQMTNNNVTTKFRNNSSNFAFQIDVKDPGYTIAMIWFEMVRPYTDAQPREIFHIDRFDMFNPYLENIGDQDLKLVELGWKLGGSGTFAYKMRYAEYKQSFDRAVGGFAAGKLPGYAVPVTTQQLIGPFAKNISPNFIRPKVDEIDSLYISLTGFSLATYFHFIIRNDVMVDADRPMEAAPQIL